MFVPDQSAPDPMNTVGTNNLESIPDQILPNRVRVQPLLPLPKTSPGHNRRVKRIAVDDGPPTIDLLNHSLDGVTIPQQQLDHDAVDMLAECGGGGVSVTSSIVSPTGSSILPVSNNGIPPPSRIHKGVSFPHERSDQPNDSLPSIDQSTEMDQAGAATTRKGGKKEEVYNIYDLTSTFSTKTLLTKLILPCVS